MSSLLERAYNPDVLTCLANLSNDEVFTPRSGAILPSRSWIHAANQACSYARRQNGSSRDWSANIPTYKSVSTTSCTGSFSASRSLSSQACYRGGACTAANSPTGGSASSNSTAQKEMFVIALFSTRGKTDAANTAALRIPNMIAMLRSKVMPTNLFTLMIPRGL